MNKNNKRNQFKKSLNYIQEILNKIEHNKNSKNILKIILELEKINSKIINFTRSNNLVTHDFIRELKIKVEQEQRLSNEEKNIFNLLEKKEVLEKKLNQKYLISKEYITKYIIYKKLYISYMDFKEKIKTALNKNKLDDEEIEKIISNNNVKYIFDFDDTIVNLFDNWLLHDTNIKINFYKNVILKKYIKNDLKKLNKKDIETLNKFLKQKILSKKDSKEFLIALENEYQKYLKEKGIKLKFDSHIYFKGVSIDKFEEYVNFLFPDDINEKIYTKIINSIKNNVDIKLTKKDITHYGFFQEIPFGMDYLYKGDIYIDEKTDNVLVNIDSSFLNFYNKYIKKNINNILIITSSFPGTEDNKRKFIKKFFPDLEEKIITAHYKAPFIYGTGIFFDDGTHHIEYATQENQSIIGITFNNKYSEYSIFNNRIIPVKNYNEVSKILPFIISFLVNRNLQPNLILENLLNIKPLKNNNNNNTLKKYFRL